MATEGREQMFFKILVFFAIITAVTGFFNLADPTDPKISLGNLGVETIPGQVVVGTHVPGGSYSDEITTATGPHIAGWDYTTADPINSNVTVLTGLNTWDKTTDGLVLTSPLGWISLGENGIYLKNVVPTEGNTYTVNYLVDNPNSGDFSIYPRSQISNMPGDTGFAIHLLFQSDGIHVRSSPLALNSFVDDYFYGDANIKNTIPGGSTYTTILVESQATGPGSGFEMGSTLTVIKDGNVLFTEKVASILSSPTLNSEVFRAGITTSNLGFTFKGFPSTETVDTAQAIVSGSTQQNLISSDPLTQIANFIVSLFSAAVGFLTIIAQVLGLTQNALVPFWLWAIIALPCLATLILIYIEILRGN
jgi:hypothetical protein